jgi:hypothetical protein
MAITKVTSASDYPAPSPDGAAYSSRAKTRRSLKTTARGAFLGQPGDPNYSEKYQDFLNARAELASDLEWQARRGS